jgi:hypothetical protein
MHNHPERLIKELSYMVDLLKKTKGPTSGEIVAILREKLPDPIRSAFTSSSQWNSKCDWPFVFARIASPSLFVESQNFVEIFVDPFEVDTVVVPIDQIHLFDWFVTLFGFMSF